MQCDNKQIIERRADAAAPANVIARYVLQATGQCDTCCCS